MKKLIDNLINLSALNCSEDEISDFCEDFSDILPLIDTISDFDLNTDNNFSKTDFSKLRCDVSEKSDFVFNPKSVPKVIS